jgi:hypothetical protein
MENIKQIVDLYKELKSCRKVAEALNISHMTVSRILNQENVTVNDVTPENVTVEIENVTPNVTANVTPNVTANVTPNVTANVTANVTVDPEKVKRCKRCPFGKDKDTCEQYEEVNYLGVRKIKACDYYNYMTLNILPPYFKYNPTSI